MAKGKKERKETRTADEIKVEEQLKTLASQIEKQKDGATDAQKEQRKVLRNKLGSLKFVRIANKRLPVVLAKIKGVGALSGAGYVNTEAQRTAIVKALKDAVDTVESQLAGKKESSSVFQVPVAE